VTIEDIYGSIECVAFPSAFERIKAVIAADKIVKIRGKIDLSKETEPSIILDDMQEFDVSSFDKSAAEKPKARKATLWLNATKLSDEDLDEMVGMLSNYEGETVCAIVRGKQKFKLSYGVNYCRGLLAELFGFINEEDIKYVE
ncbi:MAG: hypothetical protein K2O67_02465, partial [Clostridia bacterium]|nr:hypothetical protein [Clostridia bacterium]